jgi:catechol 2,3-dioxygenase-like lactoylglutathione lyase family enzyme
MQPSYSIPAVFARYIITFSFAPNQPNLGAPCAEASVAEPNILQITPFMHVAELEPAVRFFTELLGFTCCVQGGGYAYVARDGAGIRILEHDDPAEIGTAHHGFAYYIDVRDLAPILAELEPKLAALPPGDVHGPRDQPYGQRELMIRAPDGNLVVFGQAIG